MFPWWKVKLTKTQEIVYEWTSEVRDYNPKKILKKILKIVEIDCSIGIVSCHTHKYIYVYIYIGR